MKKINILIAIILCQFSIQQVFAQLEQKTFDGEGESNVSIDFSKSTAFTRTKGGVLSTKGLSIQPKERMELEFEASKINIKRAKPFIVAYTIWEGKGLDASAVDLQYRTSTNGRRWSEWQNAIFDGHDTQNERHLVSKMSFLNPKTKFIQYKATLENIVDSKMSVSGIQLQHYSPGVTPEKEKIATRIATEQNFKTAPCAKPSVVSRSQWGAIFRSSASTSDVTHLIVHHEFGSNISSDWAARVRAVQRFHINGNGWSDIGYNFLVDPNGVIYEGRAGGDNAVGAHFCGKNRRTMAVCMLGNYSTVTPTSASQDGLKKILAWKVDKEGINPTGSSFHYSVNRSLKHIAGHRDAGCSACPGNGMYNILGSIRNSVSNLVSNGCNGGGGNGSSDTTPPTTAITAVGGNTQSDDFQVNFADNDNVGVTRTYYQVLEQYGSTWYANRNQGFFNDNFGDFYSGYTVGAGNWAINDGRMRQSNSNIDNTQLSSYIIQDSGLPYMYEFSAKLLSTSGPKKFGIHIMSSSQTESQRGNSYLIWFSGAEGKVRIYETINNSLNSRALADFSIDNKWAKYRITYSPAYGVINVFKNNEKLLEWTDSSPIASGSSISLRTNNTQVDFDDLKIYKYRVGNSATVTVGNSSTDDARTSNCKVKSMVRDAAGNWSVPGNLDVSLNTNLRIVKKNESFNQTVVYPNVIIDEATLLFEQKQSGKVQISIYDLQGKIITDLPSTYFEKGIHKHSISSITSGLKSGLYILRLSTFGQIETLRILKE